MRLDLRDLTVNYDEVVALERVGAIVEGQVIGLLGANASGKTTLLKVLAGLLAPSSGEALIDGRQVQPGRSATISYLPQETGFFPLLQRPSETLLLSMRFRGIDDPDAPRRLLDALGLADEERAPSGYSGGMKQKLRIAQALVHAPRVLLLDEPTTGLDVRERFRVLRLIERLRDRVAVVFSTHQPADAAAVCDAVVLLHRGRAVTWGPPERITRRAQGRVFEVTVPGGGWPMDPSFEVVEAERVEWGRDAGGLRLRCVGASPPGGREVSPRLEDAYVLLTRDGSGG